MGVDINGIRERRENRKNSDDSLVPEDFYTNPKHEGSSRKLVTDDQAWKKANPLNDIFEPNGNIDIDKTTNKFEKLMRDADQGKFLGFGKDDKLDGKEITEAAEKLSKHYGIDIPAELRASLKEMSQDKDFKIDIKEATQELRTIMSTADKNHDGQVSPKEMMAAAKQMDKGRD